MIDSPTLAVARLGETETFKGAAKGKEEEEEECGVKNDLVNM